MKKSDLLGVILSCVFLINSIGASAALHGRRPETPGGRDYQAYYDDILNITWLADANLADTNRFGVYGINSDGSMNWYEANDWIDAMNDSGTNGYLGINNWHLPRALPVNGSSYDIAYDYYSGAEDIGYNISAPGTLYEGSKANQMAHLYYNTLGNIAHRDMYGELTGCHPNCFANKGPFNNIEATGTYWTADLYPLAPPGEPPVGAFGFEFHGGLATSPAFTNEYYSFAWAIADGDIGSFDLTGTIKTTNGADICAMVLASGKFMFSCNPTGVFSLTRLPPESDGTVKRQIYADGFFPRIDIRKTSTNETVFMTQSGTCPSYNVNYDPAFVPGSAGKSIYIAGKVMVQDSQTPICAMVLANGQYTFSCDGTGSYKLKIPLDTNGRFKLQVYADGFAPTIQTFDEYKTTNDVRMARAAECQ